MHMLQKHISWNQHSKKSTFRLSDHFTLQPSGWYSCHISTLNNATYNIDTDYTSPQTTSMLYHQNLFVTHCVCYKIFKKRQEPHVTEYVNKTFSGNPCEHF